MINSDILTNQYIDTFLQSESSFLYAVINDDSLSKTAVKVEEGWYCNKHDIYKRVFTDMLNGFKYNIEKNVIPISMSKLIGELGVWAIAVKMPYGKTNEITVFPRFAQNQEETYWRGELDSKVFYEIQKIENKELKDKAGLMIPKFLKMFDETRLKLKTESNEIPDIYCYIFYPCYDISVFRGTISMATSKPIEPDRLRAISSVFLNKFLNRALVRVKSESIKSAVSAIMTRNMSHNLGSHYLHYTKSHLEQLANRGGNFGPDIRGAARVMGYMQGRMDYLATLVSMDRYPYGCVNFKSQIFDELTIDDFSKRHFEKDIISNDEVRNVIVLLKRLQREDNKSKIVKANLESLYELSKKALTNKSHNRTTNFLLTNLILSENFTRPSILDDNSSSNSDLKMINLQVLLDLKDEDEESYTKIFTGSLAKKDDEETIKRKLSEINIALPGGVMSSHAFFNIVENFIRNSAKYLQSDFSKNGDLTITIKIAEINGHYEFTLFDNKQNANKVQPNTTNSLLENLTSKIRELHVLDNNNALDKKDKGFKEMLFSALWLRSYTYQNISDNDKPQSYEEVLVKIEAAKDTTDERIILIKQYGFELLAVDDNGNESKEDNANLALRLSLPKFCPKTMMELSDNALQVNLSNLLHIYADVAMIDAKQYTSFVEQLNKKRRTEEKDIYDEDMIIPRLLKHKKELSNVEVLNEVLHARFEDDFDNYEIVSGSFENDNLSTPIADNKKIYFQRHLSTQDVIDHYKGYAYADSVSGGNYTITLFDLYERWAKEGRKTDSEYYCQILKIKESALTRITIIDERFFKKMKEQQLETELACKNIRVLNYNDSMSKETEMVKLLEGNEFNNHENHTHFLSIHLGIIEKIIKNVDMFKKMENSNEKVKVFMKMLKEYFGPKVFISIHSGRGNFSAELEDALDMYPFISMAALENAYENSKYLLAQLFYSTIYIGKGVANHDN